MTSDSPQGARGWKGLQQRIPGQPSDTTLRAWTHAGIIPIPMRATPNGPIFWTEEMVQQALANMQQRGRQTFGQESE